MKSISFPDVINDEIILDDILSQPNENLITMMRELEGDILILGVGGKMGPSLARLAKRACEAAGVQRQIIGVSRFSTPGLRQKLDTWGIETISADLLDPSAVANLPNVNNIIFMAGRKFGSSGAESLTWAMNAYLPCLIGQRFPSSRLVVFSSGNVYPLTSVTQGGSTENSFPEAMGEYAQSVLARERIFEYFSEQSGSSVAIIRINYAIDLRYGVLYDIAQKVFKDEIVDVTMGHVNVIWQGDANAYALLSLLFCSSPPDVINVTGPEQISVRWIAHRFGVYFDKQPIIQGEESKSAFLSNAAKCFSLFGYPTVPLEIMIRWVAHWVMINGPTYDKPTHFETRDGRY